MTHKIPAKNWAVRTLGATLATGAMLTAIALPASASASTFRVEAYGKSQQQAVQNVKYTCQFTWGGTIAGPIGTKQVSVQKWIGNVPCHVED